MTRKILAAVAAALLCACAFGTHADAQTKPPSAAINPNEPGHVWKLCDGYGGPSLSGDGMTSYAATLFLFIPSKGGDTFHKNPVAGREGVEACDEVLRDPLIVDRYAMRRASLLRAKAIHQIAAKDPQGALATLDLADAVRVGDNDVYYRRSFAVGLQFVRAYALAEAGDKPKARLVALQARAQRPYSSDLALAAAILMNRVGEGDEAYRAIQDIARFDPYKIDMLYGQSLKSGRVDEAIILFPQLLPPKDFPASPGYDFQIVQTNLENRARGEIFWARRAASTAVAAASLGRQQEAIDILKAARRRLQTAIDTAPPIELNGRLVKTKYLPDVAKDLTALMSQRGLPVLDKADREVAMLSGAPPIKPPISESSPLGPTEAELSTLLARLPEIELKDRMLAYQKLNPKFFGGTYDGYMEESGPVPGTVKIKTRSHAATAAVVEEVALLRAANIAREQGKPGFLVLDRTVTQHTMSVSTYPGIPGAPGADGYSADLTLSLIHI